ncbi:putative multicopper oxidase, type 1 [Macrophomina phaseolina]|uniref:Multicopper oxidase, type 1 n=1 Tax=Macrophomina phaseolina TaxID=35725 RepID=A0ABQ8GD07_9PEZI|nr:putative multicopper oxidase, type 1 [Macrophomina phaseolina]
MIDTKSTGSGADGGRYAALRQDESELYEQKEHTQCTQPSGAAYLGRNDREEALGLIDENVVARTKRRCGPTRRYSVFLEFAILGLVLIIALLGALAWSRGSHHHTDPVSGSSQPSSKGRRGKYVLDPAWDFAAPPQVRKYHWTIRDIELRPDGVKRPLITINNEFPGPTIECNQGDTVRVEVHNEAVNSTSFHWHGIYQNGTTYMDGTVGISQCPITSGSSMTYEFKVDRESGTYWYHAHMAMQGSDGLFGPLIVHSKNERKLQQLEYASDQVIMVHDYYHDLTSALIPHYLAPDNENTEPVPDGGLINGMNKRNCELLRGRDCDATDAQLATFGLEPNKNHRLRIINTGAFAEFQVKIDEHTFAVTEVDGTEVAPAYYHRLNINPGQRYSIVINTNVTDRDSFWLRAKMIEACFAEENPNLDPEVRAIIQYTRKDEDTQPKEPSSRDWDDIVDMQCLDMNVTELQPVEKATPPPADTTLYLRSNFEIGNWRLSRGFFNSSSWRPTLSSPSLHRMIDGLHSQNASFLPDPAHPFQINSAGFDTGPELVYQTSGIRTIDILVSNFDDGNHPLHLHGYKYFVLASGHGYPPADLYAHLDISNPLRRDTASIEAFGWILLRLVADNPGVWAFHCHIGWHTEAGMLMQFATRVDVLASSQIPDTHLALCAADGLDRGASPPDSTWFGDFGDLDP